MTAPALASWHQIVKAPDPKALEALLSEDVVFFSPVVHKAQPGKAITKVYLMAAFKAIFNETFRYVREVEGSHDAMLEFEVEIDGVHVNGVDIIKWNDKGQIVEFKVMLRPLKGINIVHQRMAEILQPGLPR